MKINENLKKRILDMAARSSTLFHSCFGWNVQTHLHFRREQTDVELEGYTPVKHATQWCTLRNDFLIFSLNISQHDEWDVKLIQNGIQVPSGVAQEPKRT
jgi:hypothetical protein